MIDQEQHRSFETSPLFDHNAILGLLFFLFIAIWYRFMPLIIISLFLVTLFIIINLWKNMSLLRVIPTLKLSKSRFFPDEEFMIEATIKNNKWLPLIWLEWSFHKNKGLRLNDYEEDTNTFRFLWLLWFQHIKWTINCKAVKRGVYNIGQITLRSGDGFRFTEIEQLHTLDGLIHVYPKIINVQVPNFRSSMLGGVKGKQSGFIEDPLLVIGIREYQAGDEFRRFNWRATSRTGKLQVNIYQPIVMEQLNFYIDVEGFVIKANLYGDPIEQKTYIYNKIESFERFLSIIASVAIKYNEQRISIGLISNGLTYIGQKNTSITPSGILTPFLDALAEITQRVGVKKVILLDEMVHKGSISSPLHIYCHHITEDHFRWYQQNKHKLSEVRFYYENESEYAKKMIAIAKPIDSYVSTMISFKRES